MMKKIFTLLLMAIMAIGYSWAAETTINFVDNSQMSNWDSGYKTPREIKDKESVFLCRFVNASRQTLASAAITNCPVMKNGTLFIEFCNGKNYKITGVELKLRQWNSNKKLIILSIENANGTYSEMNSVSMTNETTNQQYTFTASDFSTTSLKFQCFDFKGDKKAVNKGNQVGFESITIAYTTGDEPQKAKTTLSFGADVDGKTIDMNLGDSKTYTATLSPNVDGAVISYVSSMADIASVDNTGKITALKEGTSTITATYAGNDTYEKSSASYTVNVKDARFVPTLTFAESKLSKFYGEKYTQTATLGNSDGAPDFVDKTIKYSSSNTDIATIDELTGEVTCLMKAGTTEIKAEYAGDTNHKAASATYELTVEEKLPEGAIVFSNEQGSFANAKNAYESNSGTYELEMKASDKRNYKWTCYVANASSTNKGGIMFEKGKDLLQAKNCEIYSPKEFDLFDGYNVSITYKFNSTKATFEYKVGGVVKKVESTNTQLKTISFAVAPEETFALQNMSTTLAISKIEIIPNGYILKGAIAAERSGEVKLTGKNLRVVKQFKSKDGNSNMLVVKDADGEAVDKATIEGEPYHISYSNEGETVVKNQEEYGESNWFIVEVNGDDNTNYENKYLKSVTGTLANTTNWQMLATDGVYPTIEVSEDGEAEEYVPNAYTPVNFMVAAGSNKIKADDGKEYFFMNPKRGEYVTVVDAVYKGGKFYVPAKEGSVNHYGFNGAVAIDDTYQVIPTGLEEDKFYSFDAIVLGIDNKAATDKVAANDNSEVSTLYKVAPLNLTNKTVTGVDDVTPAKTVVGITYYNVAGVASAKPFDGVNIVLTRYADGSTKATKELR